jgi:hypothetical protein
VHRREGEVGDLPHAAVPADHDVARDVHQRAVRAGAGAHRRDGAHRGVLALADGAAGPVPAELIDHGARLALPQVGAVRRHVPRPPRLWVALDELSAGHDGAGDDEAVLDHESLSR